MEANSSPRPSDWLTFSRLCFFSLLVGELAMVYDQPLELGRCLSVKHEDLSSSPRTHLERLTDMLVHAYNHACNPSAGKTETGRPLWLTGQTNLGCVVSSRPGREPVSKQSDSPCGIITKVVLHRHKVGQ